VSNPYEVDDEGRPAAEAGTEAEAESADASDPAAEAAIRHQVAQTLRVMALSTLVGLVVIVVLAIAVSSIRGVMILVGIVYLLSSLGAQWYLRRRFVAQLKGPGAGVN
jgi:hypothetical protein